MTHATELMMVRCRCVACGDVTVQPAPSQDPRYIKPWFCGCRPPREDDGHGETEDRK